MFVWYLKLLEGNRVDTSIQPLGGGGEIGAPGRYMGAPGQGSHRRSYGPWLQERCQRGWDPTRSMVLLVCSLARQSRPRVLDMFRGGAGSIVWPWCPQLAALLPLGRGSRLRGPSGWGAVCEEWTTPHEVQGDYWGDHASGDCLPTGPRLQHLPFPHLA